MRGFICRSFLPLMPRTLSIIQAMAITAGLTGLLYGLRFLTPDGADGWYISELIESDRQQFFYRSLLTVELHRLVYFLSHPFGFDGWHAVALSSSLAGAIALQALWRTSRGPLFLAINIVAGSFLVFVGHVENYAWVNAFFLLGFLWVRYWLRGEARAWPALMFYALACLSHMLALFYLPAYVYLLYKKRDWHPLEILVPMLLFAGGVLVAPLFGQILGTDNGLQRLVPWFETWARNHHFTFFSWAHWKMLAYFHQRAAMGGLIPLGFEWETLQSLWYSPVLYLGLPLELPLLLYFRKRINTGFLQFLFVCVICGLCWTTLWHPDWGPLDWDLFSQFAIPLHVLFGLLVSDGRTTQSTHTRDTVAGRPGGGSGSHSGA
ncbi:hypothetical protein GF373_10830 [bacterium]|nr:hypothetical protein [bacterium]